MTHKLKPTQEEIDAAKAAMKRGYDRFMALSDAEKTREAEASVRQKSRPLTPAERAVLEEMGLAGRRGRPAKGQGARHISVTVERGLLARVDRHVHSQKLTRAQFIAQALETALAA